MTARPKKTAARSDIGAAEDLTTPAASEHCLIFTAPYSRVSIPASDVDDHTGMRAGQLAALLRVIPVANHSGKMLSLAGRLADELNEQLKSGQNDAVLAGQVAELLLRAQGEDGPCDLLWLVQQLADEISALAAAIAQNETEGATA